MCVIYYFYVLYNIFLLNWWCLTKIMAHLLILYIPLLKFSSLESLNMCLKFLWQLHQFDFTHNKLLAMWFGITVCLSITCQQTFPRWRISQLKFQIYVQSLLFMVNMRRFPDRSFCVNVANTNIVSFFFPLLSPCFISGLKEIEDEQYSY